MVINFSAAPAQALVRLPWEDVRGRSWQLSDSLSGETFERSGDDLAGPGLFVSLEPWRWHFLRVESQTGGLQAQELGVGG